MKRRKTEEGASQELEKSFKRKGLGRLLWSEHERESEKSRHFLAEKDDEAKAAKYQIR